VWLDRASRERQLSHSAFAGYCISSSELFYHNNQISHNRRDIARNGPIYSSTSLYPALFPVIDTADSLV